MKIFILSLLVGANAGAAVPLSATLGTALSEIRHQNCEVVVPKWNQAFASLDWDSYSNSDLRADGKAAMDLSWQLRSYLHTQLDKASATCANQSREIFHTLRDVEDYLGEFVYAADARRPGDLDWFQSQPIPIYDQGFYPPHFLKDPHQSFRFQSGDIMLARGPSFVSAIISKISDNKSHYSHVVFVHVDENSKEESTIESYIGSGVSKFKMDFALKNENARLLVLRPKDSAIAKAAADFMLQKTVAGDGLGGNLPYDYHMDFADHSKFSCAEVSMYSFETASQGKLVIPQYPAAITMQNKQFLSAMGLKGGSTFTPADLENDSRFEMVLDWKDYRLIRDSRYRDVILAEMVRWLGDLQYKVFDTPKSMIAKYLVYPSRPTFLWPAVKFITDAPKIDTHMPQNTLGVVTVLNGVGADLLDAIEAKDKEHIQQYQRPMTNRQLYAALEQIRLVDLENYVRGDYSIIHKALRSPKLEQKLRFGRK